MTDRILTPESGFRHDLDPRSIGQARKSLSPTGFGDEAPSARSPRRPATR